MKLYFKSTVWCTVDIKDTSESSIIKRLENGAVPEDFFNEVDSYETCLGTEQSMTDEENKGAPTIELLDDEGNCIWKNGLNR